MNLAYLLLAITVMIALFYKEKRALYASIAITGAMGLYQGVINVTGLLVLCALGIASHFYFKLQSSSKLLKILLFVIVIALVSGLAFHFMPGFFNMLAIDKVVLSKLSPPFSVYLNFDKVMAALILYATSDLYLKEEVIDAKSFKQTAYVLILCSLVILVPAFMLGYIKFDPKIPDILLIWAVNNFLFVCFAEEVMFRGFLQNAIGQMLNRCAALSCPYITITITSLIFGLAYLVRGGVVYAALAAICSCFYGYTYYRTNRILCAMLVHFGLNLYHFMLFTYPFLYLAPN